MKLRSRMRSLAYNGITTLLGDKEGFVTLPVVRGPARGLIMRLDLVHRGEHYWHGGYEAPVLRTLQDSLIKPGMTVWDCGIYIGYYTCYFARAVGPAGKVIAFEPDPTCLQRAQENVSLNDLTNVHWVHAAIGDLTGKSRFILSGNTNSHLPDGWIGGTRGDYQTHVEQEVGSCQIDVYTLSDALNITGVTPPDLVKVDIEGIKGRAIKHAQHLIDAHAPTFVVELHNPECDAAVWDFFSHQNYDVFDAETMRPIEVAADSHGTLACLPRSKARQ